MCEKSLNQGRGVLRDREKKGGVLPAEANRGDGEREPVTVTVCV